MLEPKADLRGQQEHASVSTVSRRFDAASRKNIALLAKRSKFAAGISERGVRPIGLPAPQDSSEQTVDEALVRSTQ